MSARFSDLRHAQRPLVGRDAFLAGPIAAGAGKSYSRFRRSLIFPSDEQRGSTFHVERDVADVRVVRRRSDEPVHVVAGDHGDGFPQRLRAAALIDDRQFHFDVDRLALALRDRRRRRDGRDASVWAAGLAAPGVRVAACGCAAAAAASSTERRIVSRNASHLKSPHLGRSSFVSGATSMDGTVISDS